MKQRLKELIKSAVVEALNESQALKAKPAIGIDGARILRTIAIWVLIVTVAIGLYNLVEVSARR